MATSLALFFLACFGFAFAAGHARISLPLREWIDPGHKAETPGGVARAWLIALMECPACLSFWCGLLGGLLYVEPPAAVPRLLWAVELAFAACAVSFILATVTGLTREERDERVERVERED
jgi:hypothetical protein